MNLGYSVIILYMLPNDKEKLNRLEELKRKLFSNSYRTQVEHHESFSPIEQKEIPDSWESHNFTNNFEKLFVKTSMFKKFFIFSIIFFILALGYVSYMFFGKGNVVSNQNIEISILGNTFVAGGEDLPLQIEIINKNNSALELVDLIVEYPKGSSGSSSSEFKDVERIRTSLGTIPAGGVQNENLKIVLFGEQGSVQQIKVFLEYRVEGSNAIFLKEKFYDISINSTPINLSIEAPFEISSNQDVVFNVKSTLNASKPASSMLVKIDYPTGFQFTSSNPEPSFGNNIWNLGDLSPGAENNILINGKMIDVFDGEEKTFKIFSGSQSKTDKSVIGVIFNSLSHTILIKRPFIEAKLFVNGVYEKEYAVNSKTPITGNIRWVNNLDTKINDLEIRAKISGNVFDRKKLEAPEGFYNSLEDVIIWDKNSLNNFREVGPGQSGSVGFTLFTLPIFSATGGMTTEPSLNMEISISGKQALEGNIEKTLKNSESKIIRVISDVGFVAKAIYSSGPFTNTGPIPPKAEKETTYTIVWTLSNTSNNISKATVNSSLPPWIKFVGPISPNTEDLKFDASTREIVWNVGKIAKGAGISQTGKEVAFQISFIPSLSQVDTTPTIINDAILTGYDDFAKVNIRINKSSLNTKLSNDPSFLSSGARVVE